MRVSLLAQPVAHPAAGHRITYPFLLFAVIALLSGCLGPKKINKWVSRHYDGAVPPVTAKANESIVISTSLVPADDKLSHTEKNTSHFLPLLFYWQWDYKNTCTLNPRIAVNNFTSTVESYAGKKGVKQKLHGQRLQLSVDQVPNTFAVDDKGHVIWVIYAFTWDVLTVQPERTDLVVSYKLLQADGTEVKKGLITIPNSDKGIVLQMFQSLRKKTGEYLDQYDAQVTAMSKAVVDKLLTEL
ncbi:MAG TPA: hypothetical protein VNS58_26575 [Puia sp.]|nr:hypothetical protein [Puia sp.]